MEILATGLFSSPALELAKALAGTVEHVLPDVAASAVDRVWRSASTVFGPSSTVAPNPEAGAAIGGGGEGPTSTDPSLN